jgi:hypothetical protein
MSPASVNAQNESTVWARTYLDPLLLNKKKNGTLDRAKTFKGFKYSKGQLVRISRIGDKFTRAYDAQFSHEHFKINRRYLSQNMPLYSLSDMKNEKVEGRFYEYELQLINEPPANKLYNVEKVLKTRGRGKNEEQLV